jgi:HlyD family secretion protein
MRFGLGRVLLIGGLLVGVAAAIWSLIPSPISVETAVVTTGRFVATVDEDGKTQVRERYTVAAPLAGRLLRVLLKAGDRVAQDQVIAAILPSPAPFLDPRSRREAEERLGAAEAARARAEAVIERARGEALQAQKELARVQTLVQRGVSTAQALERAELAAHVADRELRAAEFLDHAAEHAVEQAKALLKRYDLGAPASDETWNVTSPISGEVLRILQKSEAIVAAGAPLMELGNPHDLELAVDVLSTDAVEIKPGAGVVIERWGGPGVLLGRVRRVEPSAFTKISTLGVEEQRTYVIIDIVSPPELWSGLGDGYRIEVRISVFCRENATIIPAGSLFRVGDAWSVYVVSNGRAVARPVELLRRSGRWAAIASGLTAGEAVIVYPSDSVSSGVRVKQVSTFTAASGSDPIFEHGCGIFDSQVTSSAGSK